MADAEFADLVQDLEGHPRDLPRVKFSVGLRKTRHHHVGVANSLHFVNIVILNIIFMVSVIQSYVRQSLKSVRVSKVEFIEFKRLVSHSFSQHPLNLTQSLFQLHFHFRNTEK